ncbi:glutamine cyclotransferase [Chryseobacterium lactis]|uniref:Glutamine cyclotransferase n=1 Tax=Chryseobacterium lactis TaxID=1241981 RepID=A0A3G6RTU3_CHRLC|nr:glutaminyl-peptide cyclotransferase [Chryseobacterium lactis]AZA85256.1 glutamine cyclotransferase [Chryseobacterium lactis]AZB07203.1 glutamine cyclotransferase [Chryseobacterium lactis]PNW14830.1 glutamine cyclotransferase [Chryseobacterium lactis]
MTQNIKILSFAAALLLVSCHNNEKMLDSLADYNNSKEKKGYHFGDQLELPKEVTDNAESITITLDDKETSSLTIDPKFFTLGDNKVVFTIKTKGREVLNQDATINVFTKNSEQNIPYNIVADYPHDPKNFVEGFLIEGNTIYESDGLLNTSQLIKYTLGSSTPEIIKKQPADIFSEGCAIVGDKIYQLTYRNKIGFIYDKKTLNEISKFPLANAIGEGWGLTYDGKNLVATDGSKNLYFLDVNDPSKVVKTVAVAGNTQTYDQLNEVEYHSGFIYANVWQKPIVLKINPVTGEAVGVFDFKDIVKENNKGSDDVLNGIAFKGDNMLVTGKNWSKIYEVQIK